MRNMNAKKKKVTPQDEADPRFDPVVKAFARTPGFTVMGSKSGAMGPSVKR